NVVVSGETTNTYGSSSECPVAEVPSNATLVSLDRRAIGFACMVESETVVQEGRAASEHVTTRSAMEYGDGYGNVTRSSNFGVTAVGGAGCEACDRSDDTFGSPCGAQCLGDEQFVERTFVSNTQTDGRWILGAVAQERTFGVADGTGTFSQSDYFYDGDAFVGRAAGELTRGSLTRMTVRVDNDKTIQSVRNRFDVHGNVIEALDPLGTIDGETHRNETVYDADGLRIVQTDVLNEKADGTPYRLRRSFQYDALFDRITLASNWILVGGGVPVTAADSVAYTYDAFGRLSSKLLPGGDTGESPSEVYAYDLGNPTTRLITRRRSEVGGTLDLETIACLDGRGRTFQTRTQIEPGRYLVDGLTIFNLRSQPLQVFQSYESDSAQCDTAAPSEVLSTRYRYDGVQRLTEVLLPDTESPGGATTQRTEYAPLRTLSFDGEDADISSPHHDTPAIRHTDGLGRLVRLERQLSDAIGVTELEYDALGYTTGYVDAEGNRKAQTFDAIGRLLTIDDPSAGTTTFSYDDASNVIQRIDGRGVAVAYRFDGLNREIERFDPANVESTRITTEYDTTENCDPIRCANIAGQVALRTFPAGADFFGYDIRRRLFSTVRVIEGSTYAVESRFDNADRTIERRYPDGRSLAYRYDGASRIVEIPGVLDSATYTPQGLPAIRTHSNGAVEERTYDQRLRLTGVGVTSAGGGLQAIDVLRDRASNVLRVDDSAPDAMRPVTQFTHDAWYRSTEIDMGDSVASLEVDLIDRVRSLNGVNYTYGARVGTPDAIGGEAISHDDAGCVTEAHGFENTWDFQGRLVASVGVQSVRSVFGAAHLRIARHSDDEVTHYVAPDFEVRDGMSVIYPRIDRTRIARLESSAYAAEWLGNSDASVTAGTAYLEHRNDSAIGERWLTASARRMLAESRPDVVVLHEDHLGSVVLATGDTGEVLGRRVFGA
ncbi:MAG: hypothetical protein AAFQ82_11685, partial [Myxococcota bacterium]